jgi:drug/metabolite transporter (DMT)-like permease
MGMAIGIFAEPVIATFLALLVLSETPAWTVLPGGVLIMLGVVLAIRSDVSRQNDLS